MAKRLHALPATLSLADEIVRIASAFDTVEEGLGFFGYDCYVDGFGSPLRLGIFSATNAFSDYEGRLNEYGLFSCLDDLRDYIDAYCERCENDNFEVIEAYRVSDACFFRVWGV